MIFFEGTYISRLRVVLNSGVGENHLGIHEGWGDKRSKVFSNWSIGEIIREEILKICTSPETNPLNFVKF